MFQQPQRTIVSVLLTVWVLYLSGAAHARYIRPDIENVPTTRLVENLEKLATKDEKAPEPRHNLARLHAMAYALKSETAVVLKGKEDKGYWFGYEPKHVPFTVQKTDDEAKTKAAKEQLTMAIARYEEVLKLDPKHVVARLGHSWCLDQAGKTDDAIKGYRKVIEDAWEKEKELRAAPMGGHFVTAEAGLYLTAKLDAEKDKEEIATIKDRAAQLSKLPRAITPIVVPMRDGLKAGDLENRDAAVTFDADGSGLPRKWSWITADAGWLVFDPQKRGKITSGLQMFGNVTFWCFWENGYKALQTLDDNDDGVLSGKELLGLAIWHDANGNGECESGEVKTLAEHGVVELGCRYEIDSTHPDRVPFASRGIVFRDGGVRPTYDIILRRR